MPRRKANVMAKPHITIQYEEEDSPVKQDHTPQGVWEPPHWQDFLHNLRHMRANRDAPVDTMGCHSMSFDPDAPPEVIRYQHLISLMLSRQTKDQVTFTAMSRLRERGLTIDNVLSMSDKELGQLIYPVGLWKSKVKYIKKTTRTLKEQYNGDLPDSVEELCKLSGVGPKTAHKCMMVAWKKVTGIGVEANVHRIINRIGWVKNPTATPEDTRKSLEAWLPFELWGEVNHLLVGFGQTICLPIGPNCEQCLSNDICPSRSIMKSLKKNSPTKHKEESDSSHIDIENADKNIKNIKFGDEGVTLNVPNAKTAKVRKVRPKKAVEVKDLKQEGNLKIPVQCDSNSEAKVQKKGKTELKQAALGANEENVIAGTSSDSLQTIKRKVIPKKTRKQKESIDDIEESLTNLKISDTKKTRKGKDTPLKATVSDGKTKNNPDSQGMQKRKVTLRKARLLENYDNDFAMPVLLEAEENVP